MLDELINDLIISLSPFIQDEIVQDVRFRIMMSLQNYEVKKKETDIVVYEGDANELILRRFLSAKIAAGLSPKTIKYYGETTKIFLEKVGKIYSDITADDVRLYLATRIHKDGVSKTTADNERRNLSSFFTWLQREEVLLKNPMNKIEAIKCTKKKKKAYSQIELEKIRNGCRSSREKAIVEFLTSTWCRASEVIQVKISDIQGDKLEVHGKGDKYRTVYLNARALIAIQEYLKDRVDNSPYLFPGCTYKASDRRFHDAILKRKLHNYEWFKIPELVSKDGIPDISVLENTVRKIGRREGVENVHPHRFRRTGATMALRQGMPIMTVSKLLGHESIETTQIYLDISDKELEQAHEKWVI